MLLPTMHKTNLSLKRNTAEINNQNENLFLCNNTFYSRHWQKDQETTIAANGLNSQKP